MITISRSNAKAAGLTRYFTGRPCPYGHICERLVSNYWCIECKYAKDAKGGGAERTKRYKVKNKDKIRVVSRAWEKRNPDKVKANRVKYRHKNSEKWVHSARVRKGRINAANELKSGEWKAVKEHAGNKCLLCGCAPVTMDHVIPLSKGGRHHVSNLQPLCGPCNNKKGTKDTDYRPDDWPWLPSSPRRGQPVSGRRRVPEQPSSGGAATGRGTDTPPVGPCPHGVASDGYCRHCTGDYSDA